MGQFDTAVRMHCDSDWAGNLATSPGVSVTVRNGLLYLPPDDTFLNINRNNYSNEPILATYTWPNNKIANAILMKFDLSTLPNGALLQEATLHLALVESDPTPEPTYTVTAHNDGPAVHHSSGHSRPAARMPFSVGGMTALGRASPATASRVLSPSPVL